MAQITLDGSPTTTTGELPEKGKTAPDFTLTKTDLSDISLQDYRGSRLILNIFPSVGTGVCSASVRRFNKEASKHENINVICISKDLPFALSAFCGAEGIKNVETLSDFKNNEFGINYGVRIESGIFQGLHARAIIVLDEEGRVVYNQLVPEIGQEPDYTEALKHVQ
ncbi:thiol peroxidase [uncultured Planktosalinus sp.]|uniref:thiol peroxidase n=1 Tax=uncultured Planktosalinus sp. TaxID=1810935 RepID=UPI0030D732F2